MTLTIDISPQAETHLNRLAQQRGVDPARLIRSVLGERFSPPQAAPTTAPVTDAENAAAVALLSE